MGAQRQRLPLNKFRINFVDQRSVMGTFVILNLCKDIFVYLKCFRKIFSIHIYWFSLIFNFVDKAIGSNNAALTSPNITQVKASLYTPEATGSSSEEKTSTNSANSSPNPDRSGPNL